MDTSEELTHYVNIGTCNNAQSVNVNRKKKKTCKTAMTSETAEDKGANKRSVMPCLSNWKRIQNRKI